MKVEQIEQSIKNRKSNRAYKEKPVEKEKVALIERTLAESKGPFGEGIRYKIVNVNQDANEPMKLGTYGTIKGAKYYMLSATEAGPLKMEALGYQMEMAVLEAAAVGLGTCWLGGTFNRGQFANAISLKESEVLPIVIPFGYATDKDGLLGGMIRNIAGSNQRKSWNELFFKGSLSLGSELGQPLTMAESGAYQSVLEMVRVAPSASNKQPWRIIKDGKQWHFLLSHTKGYGVGAGYEIQRVDMGIAVCHFELAAKVNGLSGTWEQVDLSGQEKRDDLSYIISWCEA